jgi:hypothetical protein
MIQIKLMLGHYGLLFVVGLNIHRLASIVDENVKRR